MFHSKRRFYRLHELSSNTYAVAIFADKISYVQFANLRSLYDWYINIPDPDKICHEVIRGDRRKFVIDIDGDSSKEDAMEVVCAIQSKISNANVVLYSSKGSTKTTWHVVVTNHITSASKMLAAEICTLLPDRISSRIDMSIYSKVHCLRMEGSVKEDRVKLREGYNGISPYHLFVEGIVSLPGTQMEQEQEQIPTIRVSDPIVVGNFRLRCIKGNTKFYDRIRPSYCNICKRTHDSDGMFERNGKQYCWRSF